ncbi:MAG: hypothetical protein EP298_01050 [Gammaproteobacteria bacterium]|nr:MAG: hypothetical protein EP298_01050 [Gammaproteobacteria bacterium]UTW41939.1 hypothetical protein KFE69_10560 [bacterium SCSIO 12844]
MPLPNVNKPKSIRDQLSDPKKTQYIKEIEFAERSLVVDESITLKHSLGESTKICLAQDKKDGNFYWLKAQPVEKSYVVHTDYAASIGIAPSTEINDPEKKEKQIGFLYPYGQRLDQYLESFKTKKQQSEVTDDDETKLVIDIYLKLRELAYMGILHKGINSENIMIDPKGDIHFINFEEAKKSKKIEDQQQNIISIAKIFGFENAGLSNHIDLVIIGLINTRFGIYLSKDQEMALEKVSIARELIISMYQIDENNINQVFLESLFATLFKHKKHSAINVTNSQQEINIDEIIDSLLRVKQSMLGQQKMTILIDRMIVNLIINHQLGAKLHPSQQEVLDNNDEIRTIIVNAYKTEKGAINQKFLESLFAQIPTCTANVTLKDAHKPKENDYDKLIVIQNLVKTGLRKLAYDSPDSEANNVKTNLYKQLFKDINSKCLDRNELLLLLSQLDELELLDHQFDQAGPKIESLHNLEIQTAKNLLNYYVNKNQVKVSDLQVGFVANALKVALYNVREQANGTLDDVLNQFIDETALELENSKTLTLDSLKETYYQILRVVTHSPSNRYMWAASAPSYIACQDFLKVAEDILGIDYYKEKKPIMYYDKSYLSEFNILTYDELKVKYNGSSAQAQKAETPIGKQEFKSEETNKPFHKQGEIAAELAKNQQQRTPLSPDQ